MLDTLNLETSFWNFFSNGKDIYVNLEHIYVYPVELKEDWLNLHLYDWWITERHADFFGKSEKMAAAN